MITNLLDDSGSVSNYYIWILLGVIVVLFIVWMLLSNRKSKQRQKEYTEQLEAIAPGNKVKTIGGICGIVVEVCDDNTVVIETGSEPSGKSYVKMDKDCIAQTDAKGPTQIAREQAEAAKAAEKQAKQAPAGETASEEKEAAPEGAADKSEETDKE